MRYSVEDIWKEYNSLEAPTRSDTNPPTPPVKLADSRSKFNENFIKKLINGPGPTNVTPKDQLREYESEEIEAAGVDPTEIYCYWAGRSCRWPNLSKMSKDILSIPATSAACDRAFSPEKVVFRVAGNGLDPETVEALVCLRSWCRANLVDEVDVKDLFQENID